jgi:hypothetical protein
MLRVKYTDTKTGQQFDCTHDEFVNRISADGNNTLSDAIGRFIDELAANNPASVPDIDNDPAGWEVWYNGLHSTFTHPGILKQTWNQYSESWTSPRGVVPIIEIIGVYSDVKTYDAGDGRRVTVPED